MKKTVKRLLSFLIAIPLCLSACGSNNTPSTESEKSTDGESIMGGEKKYQTVVEDGINSITIGNGLIEMEFQKADGSMVSLRSKKGEFIGETLVNETANDGPYGNFTLYLDVTSGDKWQTTEDLSKLTAISSRNTELSDFSEEEVDGGRKLNFLWNVAADVGGRKYTGIEVNLSVTLKDGSPEAEWSYGIKNKNQDLTVVSFVGAQLGGISSQKQFSLFYPMNEGEIHGNCVSLAENGLLRAGKDGYYYGVKNRRNLSVSYPGSLSMQLMQVFNDDCGAYVFVKDDNAEYKKLNFGIFDGANEYDQNVAAGASMSISLYPFVGANESFTLSPIVVGLSDEGGWYNGADSYRRWNLSRDIRYNSYSDTVLNLKALNASIATPTNGNPSYSYDSTVLDIGNDMPGVLKSILNLGFRDVLILGWSDDGFDTKYPDFNFMDKMGGEVGFNSGVEKIHGYGGKIYAYLNGYSVNGNSVWSASNLNKCAVKNENGQYYTMGWGDSAFTSICPHSDGYIQALADAVERLARNGVDGVFFDQIMEMPATLCFDKTHGHSSPATAYGEGYAKMFNTLHTVMKKYTDDYLFTCEGINDAYIKYIDVAAMMWARPMKYRLNEDDEDGEPIYSMPEITRYAIPTKVLGLWNDDSTAGELSEHAYAYLFGNPILRNGGSTNFMMKQYVDIYTAYPDVFSKGEYIHSRGVETDENLSVGVILGDNRFVVSVYNPSEKEITADIALNLEKIGFTGKTVKNAEDLFDMGNFKRVSENTINITVGSKRVVSYIITLK